MKKLSLKLLLATVILASTSIGTHAQAEKIDTPKECKKLKKLVRKDITKKLEMFFEENPNFDPMCKSDETEGTSAVHFAAGYYSHGAIEVLVKEGGDVNYVNEFDVTPLMTLVGLPLKSKNYENAILTLDALKKHGANFDYKAPNGLSVVQMAIGNEHYSLIEPLVERGSDLNYKLDNGSTMKDVALYYGRRAYLNGRKAWQDDQLQVFEKLGVNSSVPYNAPESNKPTYDWSDSPHYSDYYSSSQGQADIVEIKKRKQKAQKAVAQRSPSTYKCAEPEYVNLTADEGVAMQYAVAQDLRNKGIDYGKQCIAKITAISKVPFRGNKLVKYNVRLFFPFGYRADCLKLDKNAANNLSKKWDWDTYEKITSGGCNAFSGAISGKPIEVGGYRKFEGETEI